MAHELILIPYADNDKLLIQRPYVLDDESEEDDPPQVRRDEAHPHHLSGSTITPEIVNTSA